VGGASEAIRAGENGELVPRDANAWIHALDRAFRASPERRSPGLDPAYRWDAIVDSIEEVYRRVHAEHP
jgi:glycosyltransferase involved in cell wall biosynthesis